MCSRVANRVVTPLRDWRIRVVLKGDLSRIYRPFRDDPPTFWGELYEADFGSDWLYGENRKSRPPSTPLLADAAAAATIVPYTDRQLMGRPRAGTCHIGGGASTCEGGSMRLAHARVGP
jgi:hypothetical protein